MLRAMLWAAMAQHYHLLWGHTGALSAQSGGLAEAHRTWWRCSTVSSAATWKSNDHHFTISLLGHSVSNDPKWFLIPPKPVWHPEGEMNQQKWQDCWLLVSPPFPREPLAYLKMNGSIRIYSASHFCSKIKGTLNFNACVEIEESHNYWAFLSFSLFTIYNHV